MRYNIISGRAVSGLKAYAIPAAASDEILIEKTPDYSLGTATTLRLRAQMMQKSMPNVKLIVLLCDPASRAFSHIKHQTKVISNFAE